MGRPVSQNRRYAIVKVVKRSRTAASVHLRALAWARAAWEGVMANKDFDRTARLLAVAGALGLAYYGYATVIPIEGGVGILWTVGCIVLAAISLWNALRRK